MHRMRNIIILIAVMSLTGCVVEPGYGGGYYNHGYYPHYHHGWR